MKTLTSILDKIKHVAAALFILWFIWFGIMVGIKLKEKAYQNPERLEQDK